MQYKRNVREKIGLGIGLAVGVALLLAGCGGDGPAIAALPQTISFSAAPALISGGTAAVTATASSGLAPSYSSTTPGICSVNSSSGLVTDITAGVCIIAADQSGNAGFAPAAQVTQSLSVIITPSQTISFGTAPTLILYGHGIVSAAASSGLAVSYSSTTPAICSVNSSAGDVTDIAVGDCTIAANQSGNSSYNAATQVTQTISVTVPSGSTSVPSAPTGVRATIGSTQGTVTVSFIGPAFSGGSPITGYTVISNPGGITATGTSSPITVTCPSSCTGYAFAVIATNSVGNSVTSTQADIVTAYNVTEIFYEPETQPDNSIFTGSFIFDSTTNTVSNLTGSLTESMAGTPMATVPLTHQLSVVSDGQGGLLVTTFALSSTNTFYGGGFAPDSGAGLYYGYPSATNPASGGAGNAYATIDVNIANPASTLTRLQLNQLAYADCTALGMMGDTCMTGDVNLGTMGGFPLSQTITKQ